MLQHQRCWCHKSRNELLKNITILCTKYIFFLMNAGIFGMIQTQIMFKNNLLMCFTYIDLKLDTSQFLFRWQRKKMLKNSITHTYKLKVFIPANMLVFVIMKLYTWGIIWDFILLNLSKHIKSSFFNHDPDIYILSYWSTMHQQKWFPTYVFWR